MAINMNVSLREMPKYGRIAVMVVPSLIFLILFFFLVFNPKTKQIKSLNATIAKQDNEIKTAEVKTRRLAELKKENERLKMQLAELKEKMPEEKEVSALLKQVSDLGLTSGLAILLWKPTASKTKKGPQEEATADIYVEIPVQVEMMGEYHNFGVFYSHISRLKRIVNISNIKMKPGDKRTGGGLINASFTASTFSAVQAPAEEAKEGKKGAEKK